MSELRERAGAWLTSAAAAALLTSCGLFGGSATPAATPLVPERSGDPTPTAGAGDPPSATVPFIESPVPGESPDPGESSEAGASSEPLPPFSCSLPSSDAGTADRAQIVDVRVGTHGTYDRIVFEFTGGVPEYTLEEASPPFARDPSGEPLTVLGSDHLSLRLRGGTKQGESGESTYTGPTSFHPHFEQLQNLEEAGDFEAQSTWIMGRAGAGCVRTFTLDGPDRLVVDLEHP